MVINNTRQILIELQKIMIEKGIKKKELSDKIGLSSSALTSRFNQDNISIDSLLEICDGIDVCMDIEQDSSISIKQVNILLNLKSI